MKNLRVAVLLTAAIILWTEAALHAQGLFEKTELFVGGQDNYNTYRIPSLVRSKTGTVLAFSEGRKDMGGDGGPTDIVLKRSLGNAGKWSPAFASAHDGGRSRKTTMMWLPLQVVFRSSDKGEAWMNPVPVVDQSDGAIYLFANLYPQPYKDENAPIWVTRSSDEGAIWSTPIEVQTGPGAYSSMTVFPDGSIGILYETGIAFGTFDDYCKRIEFVRFTLDWLTDGKDYLDKVQ
jgi:hypothetical protein